MSGPLLSEAQIAKRAESLCKVLREIDRENASWKEAAREHKEALDGLTTMAQTLRTEIETGQAQAEQLSIEDGPIPDADLADNEPPHDSGDWQPTTDAERIAYDEGFAARSAETPAAEGDCPYPLNDLENRPQRIAWMAGWLAADDLSSEG